MGYMSYEEACDRGYDGPSPAQERRMRRSRYSCGGYASYTGHCGATDCSTCNPGGGDDEEEQEEQETTTAKVVTARKARYEGTYREIRPGDRVRVTSGFAYKKDGPRTGYLPKRYHRVACGPNWTDEAKAEAMARPRTYGVGW